MNQLYIIHICLRVGLECTFSLYSQPKALLIFYYYYFAVSYNRVVTTIVSSMFHPPGTHISSTSDFQLTLPCYSEIKHALLGGPLNQSQPTSRWKLGWEKKCFIGTKTIRRGEEKTKTLKPNKVW